MDRFYGDIPLPPRGFAYVRPRPIMSTVIPKPSSHHEHFNRIPVVGGNSRFHFSNSTSANFSRSKDNGKRFNMLSPPKINQRRHYGRYNLDGGYTHMNMQPSVVQYDRGLLVAHPSHSVHNRFRPDLMHYNRSHSASDTFCSKKTKSPEQDKRSDAEAIKRENLAAKLKKSLEAFKKNPSYKKKNLSIINKSDGKGAAGSCKYTSEIQPCFRWDLPLTVDDLKTIRRCPDGNESDDQPNPQSDVSVIERREYSDREQRSASPAIIYVKHCRKRKSSESMEVGVSKRLIKKRRRHRSASPKLCLENNTTIVNKECQLPLDPHEVNKRDCDSPAFSYENSQTKEKPSQSSNVMKLLGVKRREFDELVNQPRSPRVQFMLGLLIKRHKELLAQRAMRSRISSVTEEEPSSLTEELDLSSATDSSLPDRPIKLEGKGASDTIDQLSNILLESSLTVDISSLPQELIDQLGTFLELGADIGTHSGNVDESSDGEPNIIIESSNDQGISKENRNLESGVCDINEETSYNASICENEITKTNTVESQMCRVSSYDKQHCHRNEQAFDEEIEEDIIILRPGSQNDLFANGGTLCRKEINNPNNIQQSKGLTGADILSSRVREPSEPTPGIQEDENTSINKRQPQQNFDGNHSQHCHSYSLSRGTAVHNERAIECDGDIIAKLWAIDAKIIELMEEKKKLYQQIWSNKSNFDNFSDVNNPLPTFLHNKNVPMTPSCEKISAVPQRSVNISENSATDFYNVPSTPDLRRSENLSEGEISHTIPGSVNSMSPKLAFNQTVESEKNQLSFSQKAASSEGQERRNKCETPSVNSRLASGHCEDNLRKSKESVSLDGNDMEVSRKNSNIKSEVADSTPHSGPTSVDSDPDIVEIIDEPLEIIYDSKPVEVKEGEFPFNKYAVLALKAVKQYLFACCSDFCVYCFDIKTRKLLHTYKGHSEKVTCLHVEVAKNDIQLYTGSHDQQFLQFDVQEGSLKYSKKMVEPIQCMVKAWGFLFIGTKRGKIEKYNIKNGEFVSGLSSLNNEIMAIQASKEGPRKVLIVASRNMPMVIRDAMTGLLLRSLNEEMLKHITYSIYVNQGLVFAGTNNYEVVACDFTNGKVVQTYRGCGSVVSVKVDGDKLYAASYNGKIYIYDLNCSAPTREMKPKKIIDASTKMLLCMDQMDDMIFAGSINGQLKFWKIL